MAAGGLCSLTAPAFRFNVLPIRKEMQERLQQLAQDHLATINTLLAEQGAEIERAAYMLVEALFQERRIFCCGNGGSSANAQSFVSKLINRFEHERPAFPAIVLGADGTSFGALAAEGLLTEVFARPLQGLAHPGDVLVALTASASIANISQAIRAARERGCRVVAITAHDGAELRHLLDDEDVLIRLPTGSMARVHEVQLFVLHCFCDLIDQALFGAHHA